MVSLHFGLLVYKWPAVYPALARKILDTRSKGLNEGVLNLELPALPYVSPITAISVYQSINYIRCRNCPVALWDGDLSLLKVYEGPLGYAEGCPLTLRNHFIQLYRALDTLLQILLTFGII